MFRIFQKRCSFLFNKIDFCSTKVILLKNILCCSGFCSTKLGFVQQSWFCSTNPFLFNKLFNKILFGVHFCSTKSCVVWVFVQQNTIFCSTNIEFVQQLLCLFNKILLFVQQIQILLNKLFLFNNNLYRGGATLSTPWGAREKAAFPLLD